MSVRVRFAPSPTGHVHIGNIRAAIFNWLFARHAGGQFLVRIEDTDRERSTAEAIRVVFDALDWLGLTHDETPLYQSARTAAHLAAAEELIRSGHAYREDKGGTGKGECVVFRMPGTDMAFHDEVKGDLRKAAADLKDFVLVRSDGTPVFHLANVVDDIEMRVTHVIRGDDHVENTYRHVALYRALGAAVPKYAHLPMIVNRQGKPYSKRDGAAYVGEFRDKGYHADALFNYLALLGWSPGDDREKMTRAEMIAAFTLDRVKSGPAQMDLQKLTHLNQLYLSEMPLTDFATRLRPFREGAEWAAGIDEDYFLKVSALLQSRTTTLMQVREWGYFFTEPLAFDPKAVAKLLANPASKAGLARVRDELGRSEFTAAAIEKTMHDIEAEVDLSQGKLNQPVRLAITGRTIGAGLYETMELLGRERVLRRLDYAVARLCAQAGEPA